MPLTSQPFYFEFTRRDFAFRVNYEFLYTFFLLLRECNVRSTYFGALEDDEQDVKYDEVFVVRTVFRNFRAASSFFRYASPTSQHVSAHTPGASSEPSQHSGSITRLDRELEQTQITCHKDHLVHVSWGYSHQCVLRSDSKTLSRDKH